MRAPEWRDWLSRGGARSYQARFPADSNRIIDAIEYGVPVDYTGDRTAGRSAPNLPIDPGDVARVTAVIEADARSGKKAGPFSERPFPNFCVSPIGAVPKKSGGLRVIHHLSFPHGGDSINASVMEEYLPLGSFAQAARAVRKLGVLCWLIKLDVEAAYKQVPVRPEDWALLGFCWQGKFYYERVLPFGLRSSCRLWELFAAVLHFLCQHVLGVTVAHIVVHYVDDFLFVIQFQEGVGPAAAQAMLDAALALCAELGIPMAGAKTEGPVHRLTFLGLELDVDTQELVARLPASRLKELELLMVEWQSKTRASVQQLQSLCGLLNFACAVVRPGRFYLRRIIAHTARIQAVQREQGVSARQGHHAQWPLSAAVQEDVAWWQQFLPHWNGVSLLYQLEWEQAEQLELFTDACNGGYGCLFRTHWMAGVWSAAELRAAHRKKRMSMPFLELRALVIAVATWGSQWAGRKIVFRCDCMPVVLALARGASLRADMMHQLRELAVVAYREGFDFRIEHIAGVANVAADALSRDDMLQFRAACPRAERQATPPVQVPLPPAAVPLEEM